MVVCGTIVLVLCGTWWSMQLANLLSQILGVLTPGLPERRFENEGKDVLRNFIDCGELGSEDKRECIWGCEWKQNPLYSLDYDEKFELILGQINNIGTVLQIFKFHENINLV